MTFGERLKQLREERSMTLDAVAEGVGSTRPTIYRYEQGIIKNVPPEKVHALANFFGVTRPYMMGWSDEPHADPDRNLDMVAEKLEEGVNLKYQTVRMWEPASESDCITAATQALRALAKFKIARTPIYPEQILQASQLATIITVDGSCVRSGLQETGTNWKRYNFAIGRNMPIGEINLELAIHIGHIYLGHRENVHNCAKTQESECFATHLLFPRPVIRLLQEHGYVFTAESFARIFGYCEPCLDSIINATKVVTSPELNQLVKEQFVPYIKMLDEVCVLNYRKGKHEEEIDLSRYMDGYED